MTCGSSVGACTPGTESRTCSTDCHWSGWSSCSGTYVGPTTEVCGDGIDNNCNGAVDEGCSCSPVEVGRGGSFAFAGAIRKMISDPDPAACIVYALNVSQTSPAVVVIDTDTKKIKATVALPHVPSDFDISPNGQYLVVGVLSPQQLLVIDKTHWTIAKTINAATYVNTLEVGNNGFVYYNASNLWQQTHQIDLAIGSSSDRTIGTALEFVPDLELSADGNDLFAGETEVTSGNVTKYGLASGTAMKDDAAIWGHGFGFNSPTPPMILSPNGQHLYFAGYQLNAQNLALVTGATGEHVFAEDAAGSFAVGETGVFDAQLALRVATLPAQAYAAALAPGDRELWYRSDQTINYQNVDDFLAGVPLGVRPRPAAPLSDYAITKLVADPKRPRVYGLDPSHQLVVAIDTMTGLALGGIIVGSLSSDIDVSPSGSTLWIAHEGVLGLGKIDLASWKFSGFVPLPIDSARVATIGDAWVATIDQDQWTTPTLVDAATGAVVDSVPNSIIQGALCGTLDGKTLFVGDSWSSPGSVRRYDVTTGKLVKTATSTADVSDAPRAIQCASDGGFVFYGGYSIEGTALTTINYAQPDPIVSVTPDKRLAISATNVYRASDGTLLGPLPMTASAQAVSPDSSKLYVVGGGNLQTVDLTAY
jgi:DNA-binding beta-propeller fold protein YncE